MRQIHLEQRLNGKPSAAACMASKCQWATQLRRHHAVMLAMPMGYLDLMTTVRAHDRCNSVMIQHAGSTAMAHVVIARW